MLNLLSGRPWLRALATYLMGVAGLALSGLAAGAETGVTASSILLGQSAPFSGPSAALGQLFHRGASAYFDLVNARGGIHGRRIRLIALDDQYEASKTVQNTQRLIGQDKVFALFGYVGTPTSRAALPLVNKAGIPFFAPVSGAQFLREPFNPLVFNIRASYAVEIDYMLKQLVGNGKRKVAVLYQNDEFGTVTQEILRQKLRQKDMVLLGSAAVERNSRQVSEAVTRLLSYRPEVVIEISSYVASAAVTKEMRKAGYQGGFYNLSFVGATTLAAAAGEAGVGTVITQVVPFPWARRLPVTAEYQKVYGEKAGGKFDFSSLEGFIAAKVLVEGLRRTGKHLTREKLIRALETFRADSYTAGGYTVQFSPGNHNGSSYVDITAISHGAKLIN